MKKTTVLLLILFFLIDFKTTAQWVPTNGPEGGSINTFASDSTGIFAGTNGGGVFFSTDGNSWTAVNEGLTNSRLYINSLAIQGSKVFAATGQGLFVSDDQAGSWHEVNNIFRYTTTFKVAVIGTKIYAATYDLGLYYSEDTGTTWHALNNGLPSTVIYAVAGDNTNLYIGVYGYGIYKSTNKGLAWTLANNGLTNYSVNTLLQTGAKLFAGTDAGLFLSEDDGNSWAPVLNGFGLYPFPIKTFAVSGTTIYAGSNGGGVYVSTNSGSSWSQVNNGFPNQYFTVQAIEIKGNKVLAGVVNGAGVYTSSNNGLSWNASNTGLIATSVIALFRSGTNIFAGTAGTGAFISSDIGVTWTPINYGLTSLYIYTFAQLGNILLIGTQGGFFMSTDNGNSWIGDSTNNNPNPYIRTLTVSGSNIFAGTIYSGVLLSTDTGKTWNAVNNGLMDSSITCLANNGTTIFAGTNDSGVYVSTNNGNSWTHKNDGLILKRIRSILVSGSKVFVGSEGDWSLPNNGLYVSENNGNTWNEVAIPGYIWFSGLGLAASDDGSSIFTSTRGYLFSSIYDGASWTASSTGLTDFSDLPSVATMGLNVFAGTDGSGVYINRHLINETQEVNKNDFNAVVYPNPTNNKFSIFVRDVNGFLEINIHSLQGELIYTDKTNGSFPFFSKELYLKIPSGIYFVEIINGKKRAIKKLIFEK